MADNAVTPADPLDTAVQAVHRTLDRAASGCGWPELELRLRQRLIEPGLPPITLLATAACLAAGGSAEGAAGLCAAGLLVVTCTRWLDDLSDRDRDDALWCEIGPARTMTLAAGALTLAWTTLLAESAPSALAVWFGAATLRIGAGQDLDLGLTAPTVDQGWQIMRGKTAAGIALLCGGGALVAGADPTPYDAFGSHLGVALQLLDDRDSVVDPDGRGDLRSGKAANMVLVHGMHGAHADEVRDRWERGDADAVRALLVSGGSTRAVLAAAVHERDLALASLAAAPPPTTPAAVRGRQALVDFAHGVFADLPYLPAAV